MNELKDEKNRGGMSMSKTSVLTGGEMLID